MVVIVFAQFSFQTSVQVVLISRVAVVSRLIKRIIGIRGFIAVFCFQDTVANAAVGIGLLNSSIKLCNVKYFVSCN